MPSVFLSVPAHTDIKPVVMETLLQIVAEESSSISNIYVDSELSKKIDAKRNRAVELFLADPKYTHILFCDSDTVALKGAAGRLLSHKLPVVSATIYKKGGLFAPVFGFWQPARRLFRTPLPFQYNKLMKVDLASTGFLLIERQVFEKLEKPWFKCYEKGMAWEDVYFFLKCKDANIPVHLDTGLHLGHVASSYIVTNETYEMHMLWRMIHRIRAEGRFKDFRKVIDKFRVPELDQEGRPEMAIRYTSKKPRYKPSEELKNAYLDYVKSVSTPVWALSWEASVHLDKLIRSLKPTKVLDLGSGFSSYVCRQFIDVEATSVDTDPEWLEKTRAFLIKYGFTTKNLMLLKDFEFSEFYDLILLDLGQANKDRPPLFEKVRRYGRVIILDDMHYLDYRLKVEKFFKDNLIFDLTPDTKDAFDRFSWMVITGSKPIQKLAPYIR